MAEEKFDYTIFKSGYYREASHHQLFVNYGYGGKESFSFVIMRGNSSFIHNLTKDETIPLLRNMLRKLDKADFEAILASV